MTREETKQIVSIIAAAYPNWKPQNMSVVLQTWFVLLSEYDYHTVISAVKAYILQDTSGFAPSIGQVVDRIHWNPEEMTEMEAWGLVDTAMRRSLYSAHDEFNRLPLIVQRAVGSPSVLRSWAMGSGVEAYNSSQAQFLKTYRVAVKREKDAAKLPQDMAKELGLRDWTEAAREIEDKQRAVMRSVQIDDLEPVRKDDQKTDGYADNKIEELKKRWEKR